MTDASFSAARIKAELGRRGVLRPSRFLVQMGLPQALLRYPQFGDQLVREAIGDTVSLWCESATLPGVALEYYPVRRYGYGAVENKPHTPKFTDVNMVFRSDGNGFAHSFLHAWMGIAVNYSYSGTIGSRSGSVPGQHVYELAYKEDYAQDVTITQYDDAGSAVLSVVLRDAYPVYVGDVPLSWGSINEYSRVPATLTFIGWHKTNPGPVAQANYANT